MEGFDLAHLVARASFYESCVDELKRELPRYLATQTDLGKPSKHLAKIFRKVASSEPNRHLQNTFFLYAQKHDKLDEERKIYSRCEEQSTALLNEAKNLLVTPIKVCISKGFIGRDSEIENLSNRFRQRHMTARIDEEILNDATKSRAKKDELTRKLSQQQMQLANAEKLAATTTALAAASAAVSLSNQALPIHANLFEVHRIKSMKNILSNLLHSEIRYHCRAIEELSIVLESIANIDTEEISRTEGGNQLATSNTTKDVTGISATT